VGAGARCWTSSSSDASSPSSKGNGCGSGGYEADCGLSFEPGATYFINSQRPRRGYGPLETTICNDSYQMTEIRDG